MRWTQKAAAVAAAVVMIVFGSAWHAGAQDLSRQSAAGATADRMPPIPPEKLTAAQQASIAEFKAARSADISGPFVPLLRSPWPILQVWGGEDALVPQTAYERFAQMAMVRTEPYCPRRIDGADHGLQRRAQSVDGVQRVWAWVEQWGRAPEAGLCAAVEAAQPQATVR